MLLFLPPCWTLVAKMLQNSWMTVTKSQCFLKICLSSENISILLPAKIVVLYFSGKLNFSLLHKIWLLYTLRWVLKDFPLRSIQSCIHRLLSHSLFLNFVTTDLCCCRIDTLDPGLSIADLEKHLRLGKDD